MAKAPAQPCPFAVLGIEQGATLQEIRQAYKNQARRFHPDKQPPTATAEARAAAAQKFREVYTAWEALQGGHEAEQSVTRKGYSDEDWAKKIAVLEEERERLCECLAFAKEQLFIIESAVGCFDNQALKNTPPQKPKKASLRSKAGFDKGLEQRNADMMEKHKMQALKKGLPTKNEKQRPSEQEERVQRMISDEWDHLRQLLHSCNAQVLLIGDQVEQIEVQLMCCRNQKKHATDEKNAAHKKAPMTPKTKADPVLESVPGLGQSGFIGEIAEDISSTTSWFFHSGVDLFTTSWTSRFYTADPERPFPKVPPQEDESAKGEKATEGLALEDAS